MKKNTQPSPGKLLLILVCLLLVAAVAYVFFKPGSANDDLLFENNAPTLVNKIQAYTDKNNALPNDLSMLGLSADEKKLIANKKFEYKPNTSKPKTSDSPIGPETSHFYEICFTFAQEKNFSDIPLAEIKKATTMGLTTFTHEKGHACFPKEFVVR